MPTSQDTAAPMTLAPRDGAHAEIGTPASRIDARLKVTGAAHYGSDEYGGRDPAHAYLHTSSIARGRIVQIDETAARAVPGVLEILTYRNVGDRIKPGKTFSDKGYMGTTIAPLASPQVWHDGQIVAMVVADSFEAARDAAQRLDITYAEESALGDVRQPRRVRRARKGQAQEPGRRAGRGRESQGRRCAGGVRGRAGQRSTSTTKRRPSITIRSSCSPPPAPGTATS